MHKQPIHVSTAAEHDLVDVLRVQHDAFSRVADGLSIPHALLPPLTESLEDLRTLFAHGTRFFVAMCDQTCVGSVRGTAYSDGRVEVGRLVVASGWTRRGVATALMDALESSYPEADRFVLFTGVEARAPLALYASRGYVPTHEAQTPAATLVWLEKSADPHPR